MTPAWRARAVVSVALAAGLCHGCGSSTLLSRERVRSPRILGIIAEPPEVAPGQITALRVVTGGLTLPTTFRWWACARPEATTTFTASSTFGQAEPNTGCFPDGSQQVFPLGEGTEVFFGVPANALEQLQALAAVYGANLSAASLERLAHTAGLTLTIGVEMTHGSGPDATVVRGIKRVVIVQRTELNTNPPPPAFTLRFRRPEGDTVVRMARSLDDPDECAPFPYRTLRATYGQRVEIAPDANEAPWLESYDSYDSSGNLARLREMAFYSWYATDGWYSSDRTRVPTANTIWEAPYEQTTATLWDLVRDGRGGASFCRFRIDVAP